MRFFLLVLATLLIAAGGYVINDIYDIETDKFFQRIKLRKWIIRGISAIIDVISHI